MGPTWSSVLFGDRLGFILPYEIFLVTARSCHHALFLIKACLLSNCEGSQPGGKDNFHELSFDDVIVLIQPWYNIFSNGQKQSSLRNIPKNEILLVLIRPVTR